MATYDAPTSDEAPFTAGLTVGTMPGSSKPYSLQNDQTGSSFVLVMGAPTVDQDLNLPLMEQIAADLPEREGVFEQVNGPISLAVTPGSFGDVATLTTLPLVNVAGMIVSPTRSPLGFLVFIDARAPVVGSPVSLAIPVVELQQLYAWNELGGPILPFSDVDGDFLTFGWSLVAETFQPMLTALPTSALEIVFVCEVDDT